MLSFKQPQAACISIFLPHSLSLSFLNSTVTDEVWPWKNPLCPHPASPCFSLTLCSPVPASRSFPLKPVLASVSVSEPSQKPVPRRSISLSLSQLQLDRRHLRCRRIPAFPIDPWVPPRNMSGQRANEYRPHRHCRFHRKLKVRLLIF